MSEEDVQGRRSLQVIDASTEADLEKSATATRLQEPAVPVSPWLPVALASALFMDLLDSAALGTALPTLAREFGANVLHLKLALTAYLLTMAVMVPASGWLSDRFGARKVFINALRVYLLGSICCGLSSSVPELVAGRVIQGLGGAMMTPVARLIVVASTPRERLVKALNAFTIPATVGPLLGPVVAGLLLEYASWRWIFFINLPVGLLGWYAVLKLVPRLRHAHPGTFDTTGFALVGICLVSFVACAETLGSRVVPWGWSLGATLLSLLSFVLYVLHARRAKLPVLDLGLMRLKTFRAAMIGSTALRLGIGATPFLLPMFLQVGLGWTPLQAGSVMIWMVGGSMLARVGGTLAVRHFGFRSTLVWTAVATAGMTILPAFATAATPAWVFCIVLLLLGFFRASHFLAASPLTFSEVEPQAVSRASTLSTVVQQLGFSLGVSMSGLALAWASAGTGLTLSSFMPAFVAIGAGALLCVPAYARLRSDEGRHMSGSV